MRAAGARQGRERAAGGGAAAARAAVEQPGPRPRRQAGPRPRLRRVRAAGAAGGSPGHGVGGPDGPELAAGVPAEGEREGPGGRPSPPNEAWTWEGSGRLAPYYSKKATRPTDALGNFADPALREPAAWAEGGAGRREVKARAVAEALGVPPAEARRRLAALAALLPDLAAKAEVMPVARLAGLVRDGRLESVAQRLVQLKALFPGTDVGRLVAARAFLLEEDSWSAVEARVAQAAELLGLEGGPAELEGVLRQNPEVLDTAALKGVLAEMARLFSASDAVAMLRRNPGFFNQVQNLEHQHRRGVNDW